MLSTKELMETFDWASTSLGPREQWPQSLLSVVSIMENLEHETQIMWGEDYITIYNEAYAKMAGPKHPAIYGLPCGEAWPEIWQYMKPNADSVIAGTPIYRTQDQFFFTTGPGGSLEESHHLWLWTPIRVEGGKIGGILSQSLEQTAKVLAERRLGVLSHLSSGSVGAKRTSELFEHLLASLALEPHDIPFALIYDGKLASSTADSIELSLAGSLGVPSSHPSAPYSISISLDAPKVKNSWPMAEALKTGKPVVIEECGELVKDFEVRSWELPSRALVIPVYDMLDPESTQRTVLIVGLNSRRPFDDSYREWTRLLGHQILAGLTSVRFIEGQLRREEEHAKLDRAKTTFFSNVSHELRTPLTLIRGPVADLLAEEPAPDKKQLLDLSMRGIKRLQRLVDMLMDVSRVEAGRMTGTFQPHQLGVFVRDLAAMFRSAIEKGGLEFIVEVDLDDARPVYIDPDLFEKVVWNLLSNAYKYCLEGRITVFVRYRDDEVDVVVRDTGIGIPVADISLVKDRFHRVASVSRNHEGTGIGLSLANDLVNLHGGKLLIESTTAKESLTGEHGSTFQVILPYGYSHLPVANVRHVNIASEELRAPKAAIWMDEQILSEMDSDESAGSVSAPHFSPLSSVSSAAGVAGSITSSLRPNLTPGSSFRSVDSDTKLNTASQGPSSAPGMLFWEQTDTILIVDDNKDMRLYLRSILEKYVTVLEARDGVEALEIAAAKLPNLIISDVMMPNLDGLGFVTALRALEGEAAWIPVILITARAGESEKLDGLTIGAEDYLVKPFSSKELIARSHLRMQIGKTRIDLEKRFKAHSDELKLRAREAEARRQQADFERRQQELLVDVCSHETRNTNSAIFHLTSSTRDTLNDLLSQLHKDGDSSAVLKTLNEELESLDSIKSLSAAQERISDDILSLASIQGSSLALQPREVDLVKVVQLSVAPFHAEAAQLGDVAIDLALGANLQHENHPFVIRIDDVRVKQIYGNLIANALKFTSSVSQRRIHVTLEIHHHPPGDDSCLPPPSNVTAPISQDVYVYGSVQDNGVGLSSESLGLLFQRFSQATTTTHAQFGGSGLGLYLCRKLCELMDGKIEVVSEEGAGSTFQFYFKNSVDVSSPSSERGDSMAPLAALPSTSTVDQPLHVLIVEDNLVNQKILKKQLQKAGITSDVASDGKEGIDHLVHRVEDQTKPQYAYVLMDLEMPVMGGIEATTKIREMEVNGDVFTRRHTIFAITGNARQWQIDRAREVGMDDVFVKPYKFPDLLAKLLGGHVTGQ